MMRPMPTFRTGDPAPNMLTLGLVIQQADTIADVGRRLAEQFPSARFSKGTAHTNLPSLAKQGYVRLVEPGPPGEPTLDRYEATPAGMQYFLQWLRRSSLPVMVRDILQCKLEFLRPEDLAGFIRFARALQAEFAELCDKAQARVLREQRSRRARVAGGKLVDWRVRLRGIQTKGSRINN
jgi:DNA-binding PadR family transcriptional regulator